MEPAIITPKEVLPLIVLFSLTPQAVLPRDDEKVNTVGYQAKLAVTARAGNDSVHLFYKRFSPEWYYLFDILKVFISMPEL